jgi:hypothetical protein
MEQASQETKRRGFSSWIRRPFVGVSGRVHLSRTLIAAGVISILVAGGALAAVGQLSTSDPVPSGHYYVDVSPNKIHTGGTVDILLTITDSIPHATIHVTVTVENPHGGTSTIQVGMYTNAQGDDRLSLDYPDSIGGATTKILGTYHVTAVFTYVYVLATAHDTFQVVKQIHHNHGPDPALVGIALSAQN